MGSGRKEIPLIKSLVMHSYSAYIEMIAPVNTSSDKINISQLFCRGKVNPSEKLH